MAFFVYILRCRDGSLYTGSTNDLGRRMKQHRSGKGSRYVRARLPFDLVYKEGHETLSRALKRENQIKRLTRTQKLGLIVGQRAQ